MSWHGRKNIQFNEIKFLKFNIILGVVFEGIARLFWWVWVLHHHIPGQDSFDR
jgi:hypothetical protein